MLYGRDSERQLIGTLLDGVRDSRGGALVLRGEPGIGKTALLEDARDRAADMYVLAARGVESESELPFGALDQLLRPVLDHVERLPAPQAAALRGALGLEEGTGDDRFLVFAACLSLLADLAERRPVLCLIDDAHWLDAASAGALLFVARRIAEEAIVILFAAREGGVRVFDAPDLPSLVVEPLDSAAAARLLARVAGAAAPHVRDLLLAQSRGNALALVELSSALSKSQLAGEEPLPEELPLTRQLEKVFLERVQRLSPDGRRLLLVAAADDSGDAAIVSRAAAILGVDSRTFELPERAGLISLHGNRLEFRHPLIRSAVYESATSNERREAHGALAEALAEVEVHADRRAWHLAASVLEHDEDVVGALEDAGARAEERAGYMAAAKAFKRAAELSSDGHARGHLLVRAARAARIAGADDFAVALAAEADPLVDDRVLEAELALAAGVADFRRGRPLDGFPRLVASTRAVAELAPSKAIELLIWATGAASMGGDPANLVEVSRLADRVASVSGDDEAVPVAVALAAFVRGREGAASTSAELDDAIDWAFASENAEHVFAVSLGALFTGDEQRFARLIDRATALARARGQFGLLAEALGMYAVQHHLAQRFDEVTVSAGESLRFARELGAPNVTARPLCLLGYVAAVRGDREETRRLADEVLELSTVHDLPGRRTWAVYTLGMLELGHGHWAEALEHLTVVADPRPDVGDSLVAKLALPDRIEAAVRAGRREEAGKVLADFEEWVGHSSFAWVRPGARLSACCGLLAEGDEATGHFEEAIRLGADEAPFDFARIQLLYGEHLRRERRRADARVQLRAALEAFERLRAEPWAERARAELRASGETARRRDPSTIDQLTPQELQISRLVAQGLSNREVAAQLFLSPRTIDYHLRNVFAKLGIKSRTQLARLQLGEEEAAPTGAAVPA